MTLRTDWVAGGGGVFHRTMEATPDPGHLDRDHAEPMMVMQGQGTSNPMAMLPYLGDSVTTPAPGYWSYDPTSHTVYVNPQNGAQPSQQIYLPYYSHLLFIRPPSANLTFQYLTFSC